MIVVIGGANRAVTADHVGAVNPAGSTVFLSQLETPLDAVEALFSGPAARAAVKILNAAPAVIEARALFPLVDILVVNQGELALYANAAAPAGAQEAVPLARQLLCRPGQAVIVTLGATGVLAVTQHSDIFAE